MEKKNIQVEKSMKENLKIMNLKERENIYLHLVVTTVKIKFKKKEGEFKNGMFNGTGIFKYKDGNVYEGGFKDNKKDGKGKLLEADGTSYDGEWKDGKF
jgi:hypothetical protein